MSGAGVPLIYVAYLNRDGPGTICNAIAGGQKCTEEWSPWPLLLAGVIVILTGIAIAIVRARTRTS